MLTHLNIHMYIHYSNTHALKCSLSVIAFVLIHEMLLPQTFMNYIYRNK